MQFYDNNTIIFQKNDNENKINDNDNDNDNDHYAKLLVIQSRWFINNDLFKKLEQDKKLVSLIFNLIDEQEKENERIEGGLLNKLASLNSVKINAKSYREYVEKAVESCEWLRNQFREEITECSVCMDNLTNTLLIPCNHLLCHLCVSKINECPFCRQSFNESINLNIIKEQEQKGNDKKNEIKKNKKPNLLVIFPDEINKFMSDKSNILLRETSGRLPVLLQKQLAIIQKLDSSLLGNLMMELYGSKDPNNSIKSEELIAWIVGNDYINLSKYISLFQTNNGILRLHRFLSYLAGDVTKKSWKYKDFISELKKNKYNLTKGLQKFINKVFCRLNFQTSLNQMKSNTSFWSELLGHCHPFEYLQKHPNNNFRDIISNLFKNTAKKQESGKLGKKFKENQKLICPSMEHTSTTGNFNKLMLSGTNKIFEFLKNNFSYVARNFIYILYEYLEEKWDIILDEWLPKLSNQQIMVLINKLNCNLNDTFCVYMTRKRELY